MMAAFCYAAGWLYYMNGAEASLIHIVKKI